VRPSIHDKSVVKVIPASDVGKGYAGVSAKLIREVREFNGSTGLKAFVYRNDGKKVSIYTDAHNQAAADKKFARAEKVDRALSKVREGVKSDMSSPNPIVRDNATVTSLIDQHCIRIGGSSAEKASGSHGASTLEAQHVHADSNGVSLKFQGKSGVAWDVHVSDPEVAANIRIAASGKQPGDKLFGTNAAKVNQYIREKAGIKMSAKDFRTYHATSIVRAELSKPPPPTTAKEVKSRIKSAVEHAAAQLGHSPSMCKASYINPAVIDRFETKYAARKAA
jgi:DNA topoisomerase-1